MLRSKAVPGCDCDHCHRLTKKKNVYRLWSQEDYQFIVDNYATMSSEELGIALNRGAGAVRAACQVLRNSGFQLQKKSRAVSHRGIIDKLKQANGLSGDK